MDKQQIINRTKIEIDAINMAIEQMERICELAPYGVASQYAECAMQYLNLAKKQMKSTVIELNKELNTYINPFEKQ